jgi:hypothetical protein
MGTANCIECGDVFSFDVIPRRGKVCFKCHIGSIHLGFRDTKEVFHGPTVKERQVKQEAALTAKGVNWEPVGKRWV